MAIQGLPIRSVLPHYMEAANETLPAGWVVADGTTLNSSQQDVVPGGNWTVPDLRNRFIIGADHTLAHGTAGVAPTHANIDAAAGAPGAQALGGSNAQALTNNALPTHDHPQTGTSTTVAAQTHNHTGTTTAGASYYDGGNHTHNGTNGGVADGAHAHMLNWASVPNGGAAWNWFWSDQQNAYEGPWVADPISHVYGADGHEHGITSAGTHTHGTTSASMGSHTHTFTLSGGTTGNTGTGNGHESRHQYAAMVYIIKVKN